MRARTQPLPNSLQLLPSGARQLGNTSLHQRAPGATCVLRATAPRTRQRCARPHDMCNRTARAWHGHAATRAASSACQTVESLLVAECDDLPQSPHPHVLCVDTTTQSTWGCGD
eukprot:NODE_6232_length_520_cov_528.139785.p4 GENE.NODE_6232_length_520_cov_528.139785~~NODE_6232_length_520_cov_528.139785.p4  ORF type:complete len:114 (+),score=17.08 NODE_6232_length_520_cov_528.139785:177-518(+)